MDSMQRYEIILGGLLHDIGKFFQRATPSDSELSDISKGMENMLCPSFQGRYTHRHVLFTNEFCDRYLKNLPKGLNKDSVTNLACYHHRPGTAQQEIIQKADMLSSGMEREEDEEYSGGPSAFRKIRLRPVINEVQVEKEALPERKSAWAYHLTDLHPEKAFPFSLQDESVASGEELTGEYQKLWEGFLAAWSGNGVIDPWGFVNRCLGILEHFTWCIPSATNVFPDISLYDHIKTTAAISACLAEALNSPEPFLLVVTDFGGIQNYIYSIRSGAGGLARRLRARSFFVSLLADSLVYKILRGVDLPLTNCLISSGGKSYLLLPNTEKSSEVLKQVQNELDRWSIKETRGEIRVNIASVPISAVGLKDFSSSLEEASHALRNEKEKPLKSYLQTGDKWVDFGGVLEPLTIPDDGGVCDSCQKNGGPMREVRGKSVPICDLCHENQEVGRILPKTQLVAFYEGDQGRFGSPFGSYDLIESLERFNGNPFLILSLDGYKDVSSNIPLVSAFRARYIPRDSSGDVKTFEELAEEARGRKCLAYMKADVDNLGFIFAFGLKRGKEDDRTSISRLTTLSRSLDLFFSGYFDTLLAKEFPDIYTIYSGGDDLLCLGPWDKTISFALRLREQFSLYSCRSPAWTISSGICLVGDKTPVLSAVSATDRLMDASKEITGEEVVPWPWKYPSGKVQKNRITVFGTSIPWSLYPEILEKANWLSDLLQKGILNTSKIRRLLKYAEMHREFVRTGDTRNFRYVYLLSYDLRRNWSANMDGEESRKALEWAHQLLVPENPEITKMRFICEYALNSIRGKEGSNG